MKAQDKAIELVDKYRNMFYGKYSLPSKNKAKQCALIAVSEILNNDCTKIDPISDRSIIIEEQYWLNVKEEILKL